MSTDQDDNNQGTQRLDDAQGTQRIDDGQSTQGLDDAQGTQRIDDSQGTQRLDDTQGTQRLDDEQGTQRLNDEQGTQRLDADAAPGAAAVQAPVQEAVADGKKTGEIFSPGQIIELNGNNYHVDSLISQSSGEGVIYSISSNGKIYVLKYYKLGFKYPENVLAAIKNNPKDRIIKLYEYGNRNGQDFEIMEYAEGGTLDDYLKANGPVRDVVKLRTIVGQINEGLNHLHTQLRIIYQDLKPENIYFLDKERSKIVLADFGISNLMEPGTNEAQVKANVTKEYAAPELSRTGNEMYAVVGPPADYFALGITIYHVWLGFKPFQNISQGERDNQVRENAVALPPDMSADFKTIIQGLINSKRNARWGYQQISKWVAGESIKSDYQAISFNYDRAMFNDTESYGSLTELADLLEKYPDTGMHRLYGESILSWLGKSGNTIVDDIKQIITTHQNDRSSGLYKTIYTLDPTRPFISYGGKKCSNTMEIADALISESAHYKTDLKNMNARLYQYFEAAEGASGRIFAEQFNKYFKDYSPERALNLCFLKLQADGGWSITIGSKIYQDADELAAETDSNQRDLVWRAAKEKDSLFNVWLSNHYAAFYESTEGFYKISASNKFFLLGKLPFLSYKKFNNNWQETALNDLTDLIHNNSGRQDLFDIYAAQDLPFNGQSQKLNWKPTPVQYLVKFFDSIVPDQNTGMDLLRFLHSKGADLNEASGDGSLPLITAIDNRNVPLTKLLLELGADPNKEHKYAPIVWALERKDNKDTEADRIAMANLLIDYKAKLNVKRDNITPLIYAICELESNEKLTLISRMIDSGADINLRDNDGVYPLTHAVNTQYSYHKNNNRNGEDLAYKTAELLLKKGAKTDTLNYKNYWSPLMLAAEGGLTDTIKLLLRNGASKDFADDNGDTAFIYAKRKNQNTAADLLKPGTDFKIKSFLFSAANVAFSALAILWVFLTLDVLTRGVSLLNLGLAGLIIASVLISHILIAFIGIIMMGKQGYFGSLSDTFSDAEKGFLHIVGIPLLFPLAVAGIQALTWLLPENVRLSFLSHVNALTGGSSFTMFLLFFLPLIVLAVGKIVYEKITFSFAKTRRHYMKYL